MPAALPTPTGASGVMTRSASQPTATAAWSVLMGDGGNGAALSSFAYRLFACKKITLHMGALGKHIGNRSQDAVSSLCSLVLSV